MLTLKDTSFLTIDKVPLKDANEMRMYLDAVHQDRVHTGKCPSSNSHQWQLREGATLPCGFFCCCVFSPLATFPPDVTFRACCICADLSGSDPQFLLCAFLMMCLCHAERWAEMKQSGIVSVVCTLVFEKLVSLSHLDSLFLFFHFILVVWRIGTLLHTGKNGQYKGNPWTCAYVYALRMLYCLLARNLVCLFQNQLQNSTLHIQMLVSEMSIKSNVVYFSCQLGNPLRDLAALEVCWAAGPHRRKLIGNSLI